MIDSKNNKFVDNKSNIKDDGKLIFPSGFKWGAATSSHQVEGGNNNDWSEFEEKNALRLASLAQGKQWQDWQKKKFPEMFEQENYISGLACDHYNSFEQDFDIAKELGHNAHRFSIEWSRVEPEEGKFDESQIEHYRQVISALRERGIEPFVTLWHFTNPNWFSKKGGWLNKQSPQYFRNYVCKMAESFPEVKFWITLNEPIIYTSHAYLRGLWPPQKRGIFKTLLASRNMAQAHNLAYEYLKVAGDGCKIGLTKNNIYFKNNSLFDYFWDGHFLAKIRGKQDFIGVNYYFYHGLFKKKELFTSDMGWKVYPEGIYKILRTIKQYKTPVYIFENGIADAKDEKREKFIIEHLRWVHKAISEGVDVRGYFYWSLLDNFEWDKGFWPRFGLVEIDYETLERKIRPSAYEYAKICKSGTLEYEPKK